MCDKYHFPTAMQRHGQRHGHKSTGTDTLAQVWSLDPIDSTRMAVGEKGAPLGLGKPVSPLALADVTPRGAT